MLTLKQFDKHLDNYKKVMKIEITPQIFFKQFRICFTGVRGQFRKTYNEFRKYSRHFQQLSLF